MAKPKQRERDRYLEIEERLLPLACKLGRPRPGDWLHEHHERGQTFSQYIKARPVRRGGNWHTIYLCLIGDFTAEQRKALKVTQQYMQVFFDVPVKVRKRISLRSIPDDAQRVHPEWGDHQILSGYILDEILWPDRPDDALAYVAFTASDLWPGRGWNFVFGEASLRERTGVWSVYRYGDDYDVLLRRTLSIATHETGHVLTMQHCTEFSCNMNGNNHLEENDRTPLHLCPVCLRKLCWNLGLDPLPYLQRLRQFCERHELRDEAGWYCDAIRALSDPE